MDDTLLAATVLGSICVGLGMVLMVAQVRKDELATTMQSGRLEMTVVACDLRGFTAYAEAVPPRAVNSLLTEYHAAVGCVVAEVDGTVEDVADDTIVVSIGGRLPRGDHAGAGLTLARRIHEVTAPVIERWSTGPHPLGIGVRVEAGTVRVGPTGGRGNGAMRCATRTPVLEPVHDEMTRAYRGVTPPFSGRF
jgi:class 3 adenylate cyclase